MASLPPVDSSSRSSEGHTPRPAIIRVTRTGRSQSVSIPPSTLSDELEDGVATLTLGDIHTSTDSSMTLSTASSERARSHESEPEEFLLESIIQSDEDWEGLCLASSSIIPPERLMVQLTRKLQTLKGLQQQLKATQFFGRWLSAHKNSEAVRQAREQIQDFILLAKSMGLPDFQVHFKSALEPALLHLPDTQRKSTSQDFVDLLKKIVADEKYSDEVLANVVRDLRMSQILRYSQLRIANIEVEYSDPIPLALAPYVSYNRSITLFTIDVAEKHAKAPDYVIKFFIAIAWQCCEEGDFQVAGSIWEGLYGGVREQFPESWSSITRQRKYQPKIDRLTQLFAPGGAFSALFEAMEGFKTKRKAYIPYLRPYLAEIIELRKSPSFIQDAEHQTRYSMHKLRMLKRQVELLLEPKKLLTTKDAEVYRAATNILSVYLPPFQPLYHDQLVQLGFPNLSKEACQKISPLQRANLRKRLERGELDAEEARGVLKEIQSPLKEGKLITALVEDRSIWPLFLLANESIIDTARLFRYIEEAIDSKERAETLGAFCSEWLQANHRTRLAPKCTPFLEGIRTKAMRFGTIVNVHLPKVARVFTAPVLSTASRNLDFDTILQLVMRGNFDRSYDELVEEICADITAHIASLYLLLTPDDLIFAKWVPKQTPPVSPPIIQKFEKYIAAMKSYVVRTIEEEPGEKAKSLLVQFYVDIASRCRKNGDFFNALCLFVGIQEANCEKAKEFEDLKELFNPRENFFALEEEIQRMTGFYLPYIGTILATLTYLEELPKKLTLECDPTYNIGKLVKIKASTDAFFAFKGALELRRGDYEGYVPHTNLVSKYLQEEMQRIEEQ